MFPEKIIKPKKTANWLLKKISTALLVFIANVLAFMFLKEYAFIASVVLCYGGYFLFTSLDYEYELALVDTSLNVDKIIAKRKRKKLCIIELLNAIAFVQLNENTKDKIGNSTPVVMSSGKEAEYLLVVEHEGRRMSYIFEPGEKLKSAIITVLPRKTERDS